jgi:hypothetical protein
MSYPQSAGMNGRSMATLMQPSTSSVMLLWDSLRTTPPAGTKWVQTDTALKAYMHADTNPATTPDS